jgi:orotate phosphoribosyltransferase
VRRRGKDHGLQKRIEGPSITGRRVLIVDDTTTTGQSALTAAEAAREAGADVVGVAVVVDRLQGAAEAIQAAGLPFLSLFTIRDFGLEP